jgi:hypothetical protein
MNPLVNRGGPGSIPRHSTWDFWRKEWHWDKCPSVSVFHSHDHSTSAALTYFILDLLTLGYFNLPIDIFIKSTSLRESIAVSLFVKC